MSQVLGLPDPVNDFPGIDVIGSNCKIAETVTVLRHGTRTGSILSLAEGVSLYDGVRLVVGDVSINKRARLSIGSKTIVNSGSYLSGEGCLVIGEEVLIGPHVRIFSAGHEIDVGEVNVFRNPLTYAEVTIEDGAWIGGGSTILQGITIGRGAVVGAGSVVTKDVPAGAVVVGNPAKFVRYRGVEPSMPLWKKIQIGLGKLRDRN